MPVSLSGLSLATPDARHRRPLKFFLYHSSVKKQRPCQEAKCRSRSVLRLSVMGATRGTPKYCISHLFLRKRRNEVLEKTLKRTDSLIITVTGKAFFDVGHSFKDQRLNWRSHVPGHAAFEIHPMLKLTSNISPSAHSGSRLLLTSRFPMSLMPESRLQGRIVGRPQEHCLNVQRSSRCPSR